MENRTNVDIIVRERDNQKFISLRDLITHKLLELTTYQTHQLKAVQSNDKAELQQYDAVVAYLRAEIDELKRMSGE